MGVLRPLIGSAQSVNRSSEVIPSDKLWTPANGATASRVPLALKAASMLVNGERGVSPWVMTALATDAEGSLARLVDKLWPNSGLGTSTKGEAGDKIADTGAMLILAGASLRAPRVSKAAKGAVALILAQESLKTQWAVKTALEFKKLTVSSEFPKGENLDIPVDVAGKEATAEKLVALLLATATNDFDSPYVRAGLSVAASGFAISGSLRGEVARQQYALQFTDNPFIFSAVQRLGDSFQAPSI